MEIIFRLLKNDAFFPQEISRTSQTYRRQNHSACPACCAFLLRRARLPWHAQKMCAVTIAGTVLERVKSGRLDCQPLSTLLCFPAHLNGVSAPKSKVFKNTGLTERKGRLSNTIISCMIHRMPSKGCYCIFIRGLKQ